MNESSEWTVEVSQKYDFDGDFTEEIDNNPWVKNQWPLVYFIQNEDTKEAYVGESTNFSSRFKNHWANPKRRLLNKISIIGSDKFNKSATLEIESKLIQYISSEGTYKLQNGNYGMINHNYYQKEKYNELFINIWDKLTEKYVISKSLKQIENTELFKYSPYKSLNEDQYNSTIEILDVLTSKRELNKIFVKGSAGTGKTILATYLIKLLTTNISNIEYIDESDEIKLQEIELIRQFQEKYPNAKIGLVIAMSSLRKTLENVFMKTPGLKKSMVIGPSDTFKKYYDLLIIDEAHRLRQYKNIPWMGVFKKNNQKLDLDDKGTELDWIIANSKNQIFFYDAAQSIRPSDVASIKFDELLSKKSTIKLELNSQMRVKGGIDYISFVDELLNIKREEREIYNPDNYHLLVFDSLKDLYSQLTIKENKYGLCRLVAGYSWPWLSKPKSKSQMPDAIDIEIDGLKFQWNKTDVDWVNSPTSFKEVGCIHTTQGYDLNYTGIIFGKEIKYNTITNDIEIDATNYHDINGKKSANNEELKEYIINIYKTLMYRGIRGAFIFACDDKLREYFKKHILTYKP